ncbi:MAG: heparinase II/III family protein [Eubacteriales bacterium]
MGFFDQTRTENGQLFPSPHEGERVCETPPCISWLSSPRYCRYRTELFDAASRETIWSGETANNYIVPDRPLPPGEYIRVITAFCTGGGCDVSSEVRFSIASDAVTFIRPTAGEFLSALPSEHPRLLFRRADIPEIVRTHKPQLEVLRRNIALALSDGMPEPPRYHIDKNALPYRAYFGRYRDFCDRDLAACALGYQLLGDIAAGEHAKALLMNICSWNPYGACSLLGGWGDEVGLSNARILSAAYDMLYELLDDSERSFVRHTVFIYAYQCETLLRRIDFTKNPGNSHAGRIPAYMGQAAAVLWGESSDDIPEAALRRFTEQALDIYGGIFPYFGTSDGGWAEGPFYCTSYIKWFLPYFLAVERYTGKSFLERPFYRNVCSFLERFARPECENHPFGDGYWCRPDDAEWPGFFAQNPFRIYADRYGSVRAKKYCRECDTPEIYKLHLLDIFVPDASSARNRENICSYIDKHDTTAAGHFKNICSHNVANSASAADSDTNICSDFALFPAQCAGEITNVCSNIGCFPEAGFVSLEAGETTLLARASKFGSFSHMHPDNGSFALIHRGAALISPSGYFGRAYGSDHHRLWTNSSAAHNVVIVNGVGQKQKSYEDIGHIVSARRVSNENAAYDHAVTETFEAVLDLSGAYPMLRRFLRTFTLTSGTLTVHDEIESDGETELSWLLHTLSRPFYTAATDANAATPTGILTVERSGVRLCVRALSGLCGEPELSGRFGTDLNAGVERQYRVEMPPQYHITYKTESSRRHDITVCFDIFDIK